MDLSETCGSLDIFEAGWEGLIARDSPKRILEPLDGLHVWRDLVKVCRNSVSNAVDSVKPRQNLHSQRLGMTELLKSSRILILSSVDSFDGLFKTAGSIAEVEEGGFWNLFASEEERRERCKRKKIHHAVKGGPVSFFLSKVRAGYRVRTVVSGLES